MIVSVGSMEAGIVPIWRLIRCVLELSSWERTAR
jgi:hypothetical protein